MKRDEAVEIAKKSKETWGGGSSEMWLVNALAALGVLPLEDGTPPTLWELLRRHGVELDRAQAICNAAMLNGVRVPSDREKAQT